MGLCFARFVFLTFHGPFASHDSSRRIARYNAAKVVDFQALQGLLEGLHFASANLGVSRKTALHESFRQRSLLFIVPVSFRNVLLNVFFSDKRVGHLSKAFQADIVVLWYFQALAGKLGYFQAFSRSKASWGRIRAMISYETP